MSSEMSFAQRSARLNATTVTGLAYCPQVGNYRFQAGTLGIRFSPSPAVSAEIIQD
jgi:hypothetical protein